MKHLARTLLVASLLLAFLCACLPPHALAPASTVTASPVVQQSLQTATATPWPSIVPTPSATPSPPASATAVATPSATPGPEPTAFGLVSIPRATVIYYDVLGDTAQALRAELDARGPVGRDGKRWDAVCNWDYWWSWPGTESGCDLAAVSVTYRVQVTFPRWTPPAGASPDLMASWAAFVQALAEHELGHVDRAIAGVEWIAEAIRGADCGTANAAAHEAVARVQAENDAYDAATDHGAGQGARFP